MFKKSHLFVVALAGMAMAGIASAESQSQIAAANACYQSFQEKNYEAALKNCGVAADNGDGEALNLMGAIYENGYGVEKDYSKAFNYFKKASDIDQPDAINNLADMYFQGLGVEQNIDDAKFYYAKAARLGDPNANVSMYKMLSDKSSENYSPEEATKYLEVAADNGFPEAQYRLAKNLLAEGDNTKALNYLEKASAQNYVKAMVPLAEFYRNGIEVQKDIDHALALYNKASDQGDIDASIELATMYLNGDGVAKDEKMSFSFYDRAASAGSAKAKLAKGMMLVNGIGTSVDVKEGMKLLEEASVSSAEAEAILADELYKGEKLPQNLEEAYRHYTSCAIKVQVPCIRMVGKMLVEGEGVPRDPNYGVSWLERAVEYKYVPAMMDLGEIYYSDKYNHQDFETSKRYFRQAAEYGNQEAKEIMLTREFR